MFFYLLCLVPTIWFLELDEMEKRIRLKFEKHNATTSIPLTYYISADGDSTIPSGSYDDEKILEVSIL